MRSLLTPLVPALVALAAAVARWLMQGGHSVYTDADRRLYVPDPDLGWRLASKGIPWLGLESLGVIAGVCVAIVVGAFIVRWRERKTARRWRFGRGALWGVGVATLLVPIWAFALGRIPDGARASLPQGGVGVAAGELGGSLAAPAGTWKAIPHRGTNLVASIKAGGERFDSRFPLGGWWRGDPRDLAQPMAAELTADATKIDTGIDLRSEHARGYLEAEKFPALGFQLTRVTGARQDGPNRIAFSADGVATIMGADVPVAVNGTLAVTDDEARARLGLDAEQALVLQAGFALDLRQTPLAKKLENFDSPDVNVTASAVLLRTP